MIATKPLASEAQSKFIATLLAERTLTDVQRAAADAEVAEGITKSRASIIISFLLAQPKAVKAPVQGTPAASLLGLPKSKYAIATADLIGLTGIDADAGDTLFFEVKAYKGVTYMRRLVGAPGDFMKYRLNANDQKIVAGFIGQDPKAAAFLFSQKYTCCAVCAAPLTDQTSRDLGLGPVCRNRF